MTNSTQQLTAYDRGEVLEPHLHNGHTGKVDFDNDESSTQLTLWVRPTEDRDAHVVEIDGMGADNLAVRVGTGPIVSFTEAGIPTASTSVTAALHQYDEICKAYQAVIGDGDEINPDTMHAYEVYEDGLTALIHDLVTALRASDGS